MLDERSYLKMKGFVFNNKKYLLSGNAGAEILPALIECGINKLFPEGFPEKYAERLKEETDIIIELGYAEFFIIMKEFADYAHLLEYVPMEKTADVPLSINGLKELINDNNLVREGYQISPAIGSIGSLLVCYLLGITDIDPVKYNLSFDKTIYSAKINKSMSVHFVLGSYIYDRMTDYIDSNYKYNILLNESDEDTSEYPELCVTKNDGLDVISDVIKKINGNGKGLINPAEIDYSCDSVYKESSCGSIIKALKLFTDDSFISYKAMCDIVKKFKPESFDDLVKLILVLNSYLAENVDDVVSVKEGLTPPPSICPELDEILDETYGFIFCQGQVNEILCRLAGYPRERAEYVRRLTTKRAEKRLSEEREIFINGDESLNICGCAANGIGKDKADEIFGLICSNSFVYDKTQAVGLAKTVYLAAYLDCNYPV